MVRYTTLLCFLLLSCCCWGAITPAEGRKVHYRIIGFSFPKEQNVSNYVVEIAKGRYTGADKFEKNVFKTLTTTLCKVVGEVPDFGADYTWRVVDVVAGKKVKEGSLHHFSTGIINNVDTAHFKLTISQKSEKYGDAYVFMDRNGVLYDFKGNAVWYLPGLPGLPIENITVRDIKLTPQGTITFLNGTSAYEISYDGDLLWQAPDRGEVSKSTAEHYHHEFTRLANGHYMVLGNEDVTCKMPADMNQLPEIVGELAEHLPGIQYTKQTFGTLIEYDVTGKLLWTWHTANFYKEVHMQEHITRVRPELFDLHENSFFFDSRTNHVYLGIKNVNQVYKISYPKGTVTNVYGMVKDYDAKDLFCMHHACKVAKDGSVYLFNNNVYDSVGLPEVVMMKQPASGIGNLKKTWSYSLPKNVLANVAPGKASGAGGNVLELSTGDVFVSMCDPYGNVFVVGRDKTLKWSAVLSELDQIKQKWQFSVQYRASVIETRKELEAMIWAK